MDFDKSLKITITDGARPSVLVLVESGSALIGSGGHCDIRLGPEQVAVEQLFLELQPGGLFAESRSATPPVLVDGVPFLRGRVLPDRELKIGKLTVRAELVEPLGKKRKTEEGVRPGLLVVAAVVMGLGTYSIFAPRETSDDNDYQDAPQLFESKPIACPELPPNSANTAIEGWLRDAAGRHERSPFSPEDGVDAVLLYRRAASCLRHLDRADQADELSSEADGLAQRLEQDFHVHRVRLSRALTSGDTAAARHEVSLLRGYIAGRQSEFATWLDYLDRRLGLQGKGS